MKLTIRCLCIILTLLFVLSGCSAHSDVKQTQSPEKVTLTADFFSAMHLSVSDLETWSDAAIIWAQNSEAYKEFQDSRALPEREVTWENKSVNLKYQSSWLTDDGVLRNEYSSDEEKVIARYEDGIGKLVWLQTELNQLNVDANATPACRNRVIKE